jgi:hypothetical protein
LRHAALSRRKTRNLSFLNRSQIFEDFLAWLAQSVAKINQAIEAKRKPDLNLSASILPRKRTIGKTRQRARLTNERIPERIRGMDGLR